MTKTETKTAIKALPALRASLLWHKRDTLRALRRRAEDATRPALRAMISAKITQVRARPLVDFYSSYISLRAAEICDARMSELARAVPGLVRL